MTYIHSETHKQNSTGVATHVHAFVFCGPGDGWIFIFPAHSYPTTLSLFVLTQCIFSVTSPADDTKVHVRNSDCCLLLNKWISIHRCAGISLSLIILLPVCFPFSPAEVSTLCFIPGGIVDRGNHGPIVASVFRLCRCKQTVSTLKRNEATQQPKWAVLTPSTLRRQ